MARALILHRAVSVYPIPDTTHPGGIVLPENYHVTDLQPLPPNEPPVGWIHISFMSPTTWADMDGFVQNRAGDFDVTLAPTPTPTLAPQTFWQRNAQGFIWGVIATTVVVFVIFATLMAIKLIFHL